MPICGISYHSHKTRRVRCNTVLLKKIKYGSSYKYTPKKLYLYNGVKNGLETLLLRDGFLRSCNHWRNSTRTDDCLTDVMDGQIWKEFMFVNGRPFLNNLAL